MVVYDANAQKFVVVYNDAGNSYYGTAIVGTVDPSNNSISYGTAVVFESASTSPIAATFDSSNNKVVIAYGDGGNSIMALLLLGQSVARLLALEVTTVFDQQTLRTINYV